MLAQDRSGEGSQRSAGDAAGIGLGGRNRGFGGAGWPAALVAWVDGPELVPGIVEAGERVEPGAGELVDLAVDLGELGEVGVALDLELEASHPVELGPSAVVQKASAGGHGLGPCGWLGRVGRRRRRVVGGAVVHGWTSEVVRGRSGRRGGCRGALRIGVRGAPAQYPRTP